MNGKQLFDGWLILDATSTTQNGIYVSILRIQWTIQKELNTCHQNQRKVNKVIAVWKLDILDCEVFYVRNLYFDQNLPFSVPSADFPFTRKSTCPNGEHINIIRTRCPQAANIFQEKLWIIHYNRIIYAYK